MTDLQTADGLIAVPRLPFTASQAMAFRVDRNQLRRLEAQHHVRQILRGVWLRSDVPDTLELRAAAAGLVCAPGHVFVDRTAAWLYGIDVLRYDELDVPPPVEVFVLRGRKRVTRDGCASGERDLAPGDILIHRGLSVTTPVRTALDLGCRLSKFEALAALDAFMHHLGVTRAEMARELPRYRRRRGVVQLRALVPLADGRAESSGESWTRLAIVENGFPRPHLQWWVEADGLRLFRLDLAYPKSRVAVEYDGREFHTSAHDRLADEERRRWLRQHGWTVIVLTKESFAHQAARDQWIGELRRALRSA